MDFTDGEFQLTFPDGSMSLFEPLWLNFKSPSEHTVEGKHHDLEMQIFHQYKGTNGQYGAVIAIFFDRGDGGEYDNAFIESLNFRKARPDPGYEIPNAVDLKSFLFNVDMSRYWSYEGSLTQPPCSEGIAWSIIYDVQPISLYQMEGIAQYFLQNEQFAFGRGNNRAVQELYDRKVYHKGIGAAFNALALSSVTTALVAMLSF